MSGVRDMESWTLCKLVAVVDDEPDTNEMIAEMIRLNGHEVIRSFDGHSAMQLISREMPDLVVMDVMMPDLSGLEVLRFMRRDPRLKHIPVIVLSARSRPEDIQEGIQAGAARYLTKPVAFDEVKAAVQSLITAS
jgi:DNA-binding response OmpR family regulator